MNWEAIGAIGEVFGGFAVLATLVYLAVQVRQAKKQIALNGIQERARSAVDLMMPIAVDPSLASIVMKAGHPPYGEFGLDPEEAHRFGAWCHAWMQWAQANHYLLPEGAHDDLLKLWLLLPAWAEFWEKNKGIFDTEFVERMEGLKKSLESSDSDYAEIFSGNDRS
jgi:hypothetical protein